MATIGSLVVDFKSNTAQFNAGIKAANNNMRSFERQAKRSGRSAQRAFLKARRSAANMVKSLTPVGPLLAGGVVAGFVAATKAALDSADSIVKTADAAGLSTDALQALRFQASQTGVGAEALDKAMLKFNKSLGEAKDGTGTLITILNKSDPALLQRLIRTRDQAEALRLLADAIKNETDGSRAAALANAAFGRQGARLVKTFQSGAIGIEEFMRRARAANLVIGRDMLHAAEQANDKMDQLTRTIKKSLTVALVTLAPQIQNITEELLAAMPKMLTWIERFGSLLGIISLGPVEQARVNAAAARGTLNKNLAVIKKLKDKANNGALIGAGRSTSFDAAIKFRETLVKKLRAELAEKERLLAVEKQRDNLAHGRSMFGAPNPLGGPVTAASKPPPPPALVKPVKPDFSRFNAFLDKQAALTKSIADLARQRQSEAKSLFESLRTPAERYAAQLKRIKDLQASGGFAQAGGNVTAVRAKIAALLDMAQATGKVTTAMRELAKINGINPAQIQQATAALQQMDPVLQRIRRRNDDIARSLAQAIGFARTLNEVFSNVKGTVLGIIRQLVLVEPLTRLIRNILNSTGIFGGAKKALNAAALQAAIAQGGAVASASMTTAITTSGTLAGGAMSTAIVAAGQSAAAKLAAACAQCQCQGGKGGGGGGGFLKTALTVANLAQNIPTIPGLASGGPVSAGSTILVGEKGPELFSPSVPGRIIANDRIAGPSRAVVNINVDASGAVSAAEVDRRVRVAVAAAAPEILKIAEVRSFERARAVGRA